MNKTEILKSMEQAVVKCAADYEEDRKDSFGSTYYNRKKEVMDYLLTVFRDAQTPEQLVQDWEAEILRLNKEIDIEDMHPTFCEADEYYYGKALMGRRAAFREMLAILKEHQKTT